MKTNWKLFALSMLTVPMLAACGTYTNDEFSGYGYDRDNVKGHNNYRPEQSSYMNYQQVDTHCAKSWCKGSRKDGEGMFHDGKAKKHRHDGANYSGHLAPDGGSLMKAKSKVSMDDAYAKASKECRNFDGFRVWKKGVKDDKFVVKFTCFDK